MLSGPVLETKQKRSTSHCKLAHILWTINRKIIHNEYIKDFGKMQFVIRFHRQKMS